MNAIKRYLLLGFSLAIIPFYFILAYRHLLADIHFMGGTNDYKVTAGLMPHSLMYMRACIDRHKDIALKKGELSSLYYAEKLALKNVKFHPENPWALSDLGAVEMAMVQLGKTDRWSEAEKFFYRAYEAGPYLYKNVLNLSMFYRFKGEMELAEKYAAFVRQIKNGGNVNE